MRNLPIILLLAVFLVLATLYSAAIPLGEGPDEPGHAGYAFFLARAGRMPVQRLDAQQTDVPGEGHQPPLAYALAAPLALWLPREERRLDTIGNPRFTWSDGTEVNAISHGSREFPPWQGAVLAWQLMRLVSAGLGAATVWFTYLAARELQDRSNIARSKIQNPTSKIALLAAGLVAFNPQFLFVSALVTNDALLTAFCAAMLWLVVRQVNREHTPLVDAIAIGAVLGLALLTKQSALVLGPIALLGVAQWRQGDAALRRSAGMALVVLATAAAISGWWYLRNQRLYGDLLGLAAFRGEFMTQPFEAGSPLAWVAALAQLHASFWARFGWMNVAPPDWTLWLIGAVELVAAAGLLMALRANTTERVAWARTYWPLLGLPALAFAWIFSFALTAGLVAWQGRLLFPALPAIAILLAFGLASVGQQLQTMRRQPPRDGRLSIGIMAAAIGLLFILAAWMPQNVIVPAYPRQTLPEAVAQERIGTPTIIRFRRRGERSVTLRGWRMDGQAKPGTTLDLTLIWYASSRQTRNWVIFLELIDKQGQVVSAVEGEPRGGAFPTTQWNMGDWVEDRHQLALPADLSGGSYTLRLGLQDPSQENRRAGVYKLGGELIGETLDLGSVEIGAT